MSKRISNKKGRTREGKRYARSGARQGKWDKRHAENKAAWDLARLKALISGRPS